MSNSNNNVTKKPVSRRSVLKWSGALAAAGVVGIGLGFGADLLVRPSANSSTTTITASGTTATTTVTAPPAALSYTPPLSPSVQVTSDALVQSLVNKHQGETEVFTSCSTLGACFANCLLKLRVKNGIITSVEPDDRAFFQGVGMDDAVAQTTDLVKGRIDQRPCARPYAIPQLLYSPDRILYPMMRASTSTRGDPNGSWVRITYDQAAQIVAQKLQYYKSTYGPQSVIYCQYGGNTSETCRMLSLYGVGNAGWGYCSWDASRHSMRLMLGRSEASGAGSSQDNSTVLLKSKLIVCFGVGANTTHDGGLDFFLKLARESGTKVIWIDPKYTNEAETLADQWIPIRPGTDTALLLAMADVLFRDNSWNQSFISQFVEPTGFQTWQNYVLGVSDGVEKTPAWAAAICGVPADTITALTRLIVANSPTYFRVHVGAMRESYGEDKARSWFSVLCMLGLFGVPGAWSIFGTGSAAWTPYSMSLPALGGYGTYNSGQGLPTRFRAETLWAEAILLLKQVNAGTLTQAQYSQMVGDAYSQLPLPNYKLGFAESNTMTSHAVNTPEAMAAIKQLDYFITVQRRWNLTARVADLVVPAPEVHEGDYAPSGSGPGPIVAANGFGTAGFVKWNVSTPQGEVMPYRWFLTQVANLLGVGAQYNTYYAKYGDNWDQMVMDMSVAAYSTFEANMSSSGYAVPSWNDFFAHPRLRFNEYLNQPFNYDWQGQVNAGNLGTPSKKIEFFSSTLDAQNKTPQPWNGNGPMTPEAGQAKEMTVNAYPLPAFAQWHPPLQGYLDPNTDHTNYPITLLTPHSRYRGHSVLGNNPLLRNDVYQHRIWISATDAIARGIVDGDPVQVTNSTGQSATTTAYVTSRVLPGAAVLHYAAWNEFDANGNDTGANAQTLLWPLHESPRYPANTKNAVQIKKISSFTEPQLFWTPPSTTTTTTGSTTS